MEVIESEESLIWDFSEISKNQIRNNSKIQNYIRRLETNTEYLEETKLFTYVERALKKLIGVSSYVVYPGHPNLLVMNIHNPILPSNLLFKALQSIFNGDIKAEYIEEIDKMYFTDNFNIEVFCDAKDIEK